MTVEKLSFHLILPTGKISFSVFFNSLINFQEINIFWKIFSFLQLNTTLVQINWRIYFFFISGKTLHQFLEFYPQVKNTFSIFLLSQFAFFNFLGKEKMKLGSLFTLGSPKTVEASSARLSPRAHAAPRPQPGPGPAKCCGALPPPGPLVGPCIRRRWI